MISKKIISGGIAIYFFIRLFSYFFSPSTPLYSANPINWIASALILIAVIYFLIKRDERGWLIIAGEIILGGAGGFFEIYNLSLRTLLLILSIGIFFVQTIKDKDFSLFFENKIILYILIALYAVVGVSAIRGLYLGNETKLIIADSIPYLFFLYYFPLKQLATSDTFINTSTNLVLAAIIGNFIFMFFTLIGFSTGIFVLQDSYYHWFRDVASGKITDFGTGFFRILANEQLLIIPIFLWLFYKIIHREENIKIHLFVSTLLLMILSVNITRIYFIALAAGILILFTFKNWRRWLAFSAGALAIFVVGFTATHLAVTKTKSFGWEFLGLRLQSIAAPQIEDSSFSRMLLLPKIVEKIKSKPILGHGLGDTVSVYSPVFKQEVTTPHFDWGYLEIFAEIGLIGLLAWFALIIYLVLYTRYNRASISSFIALATINITSPALFHVMGIFLIVCLLSTSNSDL